MIDSHSQCNTDSWVHYSRIRRKTSIIDPIIEQFMINDFLKPYDVYDLSNFQLIVPCMGDIICSCDCYAFRVFSNTHPPHLAGNQLEE